jgi:uncharacterized protein YndB with AHSA1/START domain
VSAQQPSPTQPADRVMVLTRTFDAPRARVFRAWLDPQQLARWWSPKGFTNPVCEVDARPGGAIFILMRAPDGTDLPMKGVFHEIVEPERLVLTTTALEDADGNPQIEVHNTVTFADDGAKTTLTLRSLIVKAGPEAETALAGMTEGWSQSLDKLAALVAGA